MQLSLKCFLFVLFKKIVCISIKPFFPPASFSGYSLFNSMKPICQLFIITLQQQDKKVTNSPHLSCALTYFYFFPSNHTESFKPFSLSNVLFSWLPWQLVLLFFSLFLDLLFFFFLIHQFLKFCPYLSLSFTAVLFYPNPTHSSKSRPYVTSCTVVRTIAVSVFPPPLPLCRDWSVLGRVSCAGKHSGR